MTHYRIIKNGATKSQGKPQEIEVGGKIFTVYGKDQDDLIGAFQDEIKGLNVAYASCSKSNSRWATQLQVLQKKQYATQEELDQWKSATKSLRIELESVKESYADDLKEARRDFSFGVAAISLIGGIIIGAACMYVGLVL